MIQRIRNDDELNVLGNMDIEMSAEVAAIHCHASWWNSTDTMIASRLITRDETRSRVNGVYTVSAVFFLVIFVLLVIIYHFVRKYRKAQEFQRNLTDNEVAEFFQGKPEWLTNAGDTPNMEVVDFLPYNTDYEIPLDDLEFDTSESNFLGRGHFSYVVRGKVLSKTTPVAIKVSLSSSDVTLFKSLLSEVKIMIYIGQPENVVALVGVCNPNIRNRCVYIATEICESGSLQMFLRNMRPTFVNLMNPNQELDMSLLPFNANDNETTCDVITSFDLISFSGQIANGMDYLSYKSTLVPWRWMAIESLKNLTFSTASDVWAYGVTLYEIFTLGDAPFPNEEWNNEFLARLEGGMRMGRPKYSTPEIYTKIVACWGSNLSNRPSFGTLRVFFEHLCKRHTCCTTASENTNSTHTPSSDNGIPQEANYKLENDAPTYTVLEVN